MRCRRCEACRGPERSFRGRQAVWHAAVNRAWKHIAGSIPALGAVADEARLVRQGASIALKASSILVIRSDVRVDQRQIARTTTRRLAGSIPAVHTMSRSSRRLGLRSLKPETSGSTPTRDALSTPSSNGSGSDAPNVGMVGSSPPGVAGCLWVAQSWRSAGCLWVAQSWRSAGFPKPRGRVRSPGGLLTWSWPRGWRTRGGSSRSAGESPGDHAFAATRGSGRWFHKPCGVRFKSARCDEVFEV
jgi:hypothetical protein